MIDAQGPRSGTMFGPYRLMRLLGRGGMGEVYEAEHTVKQWTVALKLMSHTFSQDPVFRARMEREARITGRLLEPHVVPIHDYGEIDGQLYLEMRLIDGVDLDNLLEREGPLSPPRAVAIIHQVASALDAAHAGTGKTAPPSTAAPGDDQARLISLLPPGYLPGTCMAATAESGSIWVHAVAMVTCGQNTQPGGPSRATYGLFGTPDRLKKAFSDDIGNVSLVNCPGEGRSPVSWHYDETPNDMAGLIACGTYNSHPNVIWSNDARLMLSDVTGDPATVEDLHTWWDAYG